MFSGGACSFAGGSEIESDTVGKDRPSNTEEPERENGMCFGDYSKFFPIPIIVKHKAWS